MRVIDDVNFFEYQRQWFKTQFKKGKDAEIWSDFRGVEIAYKMSRNDFYDDVKHLRAMLNENGLKRLSNAISAYKKRENRVSIKSIQINVDIKIAEKFKKACDKKGMTQSELFEALVKNKVKTSIFK